MSTEPEQIGPEQRAEKLRKAGANVSDFSLAKLVAPGGKDLADTFNPYPCTDVLWRFETRAEQLQGGESL